MGCSKGPRGALRVFEPLRLAKGEKKLNLNEKLMILLMMCEICMGLFTIDLNRQRGSFPLALHNFLVAYAVFCNLSLFVYAVDNWVVIVSSGKVRVEPKWLKVYRRFR